MPGDYDDRERLAVANDNKLRTSWFTQCFGLMQEAGDELNINQSDLLSLWEEFIALRKKEAELSKSEFDTLMTGRDASVLDDPKVLAHIVAEGKKKAARKFVQEKLLLVSRFEKLIDNYQQALGELKSRYEKAE